MVVVMPFLFLLVHLEGCNIFRQFHTFGFEEINAEQSLDSLESCLASGPLFLLTHFKITNKIPTD